MNVTINWMDNWANSPRIEVSDLDVPNYGTQPYRKEGCIHRADFGIVVEYFHSDGRPTEGYGGREFKGKLVDGTEFCYKGAWSSRAACVNKTFPGDPVVDVIANEFSHTAIRVAALANWWLKNQPSWGLAIVDDGDEGYTVQPTREGELKGSGKIVLALCGTERVNNLNEFMKGFQK